ncbi:hypothetical protein M9R32_08025 [Paenisporosarcina quisquiliarum]|uniref:Lipoprotein n=1 Tax=Paenisporosarcina quisquiliarum TaxID=365346 RepID=A0A9X3RE48_9BACL|nr:hypothetical protein [Paenisporosarcina quisquiliarum]MCZ8537122.1 hypothetical protein [Paenisporosarcina quisquiliarum]
MHYNQFKKIRSIFFLMLSCLLFVGCSQEKLDNQGEIVVTEDVKEKQAVSEDDEKNKEAVRAVLESEFTAPNETYIQIQKDIDKKSDEIEQSLPDDAVGFEFPADSPEWLAYEELVSKSYKSYYTDHLFERLIPTSMAFDKHLQLYFNSKEYYNGETRYAMKVSDMEITQSENENTPKHYDFSLQVEYTNHTGEVSKHNISGNAILSEVGKIGKFSIRDDGGLREKVREN